MIFVIGMFLELLKVKIYFNKKRGLFFLTSFV